MPDAAESLEASVFARDCASRQTLQNATSRWGVLALAALTEGDYRFNALRRRVDGVSERMLSQTLQTLERDGLVVRTVQGTIPPKVEYSLTPLGRDVGTRLSDLIELIEGNMPLVLESRTQHDAR
ncbi:transcriptional regulator [Rhodococcus sp. 14-2483-1-1]|uniref:winged helix-turn-helix transcriptional regulator n=1 Tax=Nocardiaceae TaxID=85025 RepID=UPI00050C3600|nr:MULTISPECIES: helix-turn-helix domain-containing protein [Rhodococcus]OZE85850.1 transcriptional regulator [Rhodococcus sp. 15-649-2-2]OZF40507.1 transcriptional regulator [Rhodococcus sp. 14-2483-1-1]QIH99894.1 helix-turn-helix transcriptional regulator [Rhodococcus fascians A21d2]QII07730.1 helix-turn-helix transcriptional regulator [Rhodococcus fascians A25f]